MASNICRSAQNVLQGNCTGEAPPRAPTSTLSQLPPGHCMLTVPGSFLTVRNSLWLHNLFILQRGASRDVISVIGPDARLWITHVALEVWVLFLPSKYVVANMNNSRLRASWQCGWQIRTVVEIVSRSEIQAERTCQRTK